MSDAGDASRPIFLVGFMGSGKSAAGRVLAELLGWSFEDTDRLVEERAGRSIEEIFRTSGEGRFRETEWEVLVSLRGRERTVVATGGGTFLGGLQRRLMKSAGTVVWLDVDLETAARRARSGEGRPLWRTDDPVDFRAFFHRRRAVYALADVRIDAGGDSPEAVAARILDRVRPRLH